MKNFVFITSLERKKGSVIVILITFVNRELKKKNYTTFKKKKKKSIKCLNFKFFVFKIVHKRRVSRSNSKLHPIGTKLCVSVNNIESM